MHVPLINSENRGKYHIQKKGQTKVIKWKYLCRRQKDIGLEQYTLERVFNVAETDNHAGDFSIMKYTDL